MTYYVVQDAKGIPPSILHEDNYFAWYNPFRRDHRVEYRGSINRCYDFIARYYPTNALQQAQKPPQPQ
ncbi:hypothetical protein [Pasteuria penetrans]|uniref:hypothetical protein n=1 Tax=Pasteuria penetrans TaxID=86005 RepID=UPI000F916959|nr:hypothetical protein [Pasteuria penetrans]